MDKVWHVKPHPQSRLASTKYFRLYRYASIIVETNTLLYDYGNAITALNLITHWKLENA
jgi:hypothetical protein